MQPHHSFKPRLKLLPFQLVFVLVEIDIVIAPFEFATLEIEVIRSHRFLWRTEGLVMIAVGDHPILIQAAKVKVLPCELLDLEASWQYFRRADLHKLSAVDAISFVIMTRARIRVAYTFDHHFAMVGFRLVS